MVEQAKELQDTHNETHYLTQQLPCTSDPTHIIKLVAIEFVVDRLGVGAELM